MVREILASAIDQRMFTMSNTLNIGLSLLNLYQTKADISIQNSYIQSQIQDQRFRIEFNAKVGAFNLSNAFLTAKRNQAVMRSALSLRPIVSSYTTTSTLPTREVATSFLEQVR